MADTPRGVGDHMADMLSWVKPAGSCSTCKDRARKMNQWGPEGCRKNRDKIIRWLREARDDVGIPWWLAPDPVLNNLLNIAIRRAEREAAGKPLSVLPGIINTLNLAVKKGSKRATRLSARDKVEFRTHDWPFIWPYLSQEAKGEELRYSIRSVLHWYPEAEVVVIGDKPDWYKGKHIPAPRLPRQRFQSFKDVFNKLKIACSQYDQFVWMHDDMYWVNEFKIRDAATPKYIRYVTQEHYKDWLKKKKNPWAQTKKLAYEWLLVNNRPTYDFAAHLPQPIISKQLLELDTELNLSKNYRNFEICYFNTYRSADAENWSRLHLRVNEPVEHVYTEFKLLNHTNAMYAGVVEKFLAERFPLPSLVE